MGEAAGTPVKEALEGAVGALEAAGVDDPRLDAELLLAEAASWPRAQVLAEPDTPLPRGASRRFGETVRRRTQREPVAYILGRKGFRAIEVEVDRTVLIPRPETELLVEIAVELEAERVLEVGTGSGAVALAIADELPDSDVFATDISLEALALARRNAAQLELDRRVHFAGGGLPPEARRFDLVVANLPYVSEGEWRTLAPEITEYEPRMALVAGPTGLEAIEAVVGELASYERRPSALALEVGAGQAPAVSELVRKAGYAEVETRPDLAGIERVVLGR